MLLLNTVMPPGRFEPTILRTGDQHAIQQTGDQSSKRSSPATGHPPPSPAIPAPAPYRPNRYRSQQYRMGRRIAALTMPAIPTTSVSPSAGPPPPLARVPENPARTDYPAKPRALFETRRWL